MNSRKKFLCAVGLAFVPWLSSTPTLAQEHNNSGMVFKMPGCSTEGADLESTLKYIEDALSRYGSAPAGEIQLFYRLQRRQNTIVLNILSQSGDHPKVKWAPLEVAASDLDCRNAVLQEAGIFFVHASCEKKKRCVLNVTDAGSEPFSDRLSIGMTTDQEHAVRFAQALSRLIFLLRQIS